MLLKSVSRETCARPRPQMRLVEGGSFTQGSLDFYPEEAPLRRVQVGDFLIDTYPVTVRKFAAFVADTGYTTLAERPLDPVDYPGVPQELLVPGALVFALNPANVRPLQAVDWWSYCPGANWRAPLGPGSGLEGLEEHPVTQVAYEDACAYAAWAGKRLPREAEWEFAARGGLEGKTYAWGDHFMPAGTAMANIWRGSFPFAAREHAQGTSPVGDFPPNGYGLYDMIGNVWEWTSDWYHVARSAATGGASCCSAAEAGAQSQEDSLDPAQPGVRIPRKVVKGGSFLCSPDYCRRYRPAARQPQMIDTASCHIGFRCAASVE
jgi:formylglycine-generating enzyme